MSNATRWKAAERRLNVGRMCSAPVILIMFIACLTLLSPCVFAQDAPTTSDPSETDDSSTNDPSIDDDIGKTKKEPTPLSEEEQLLVRLRNNLAAALSASGLVNENERQAVAQRLDEVAEESGKLAKKLPKPEQQQEAYNNSIIADYELAQQAAQQRQPREWNYRIGRARGNARNLKQIESPEAQALGDFWLMQSDLFEINQSGLEPAAAQKQIIDRMERFLSEQDALPTRKGQGQAGAAASDKSETVRPGRTFDKDGKQPDLEKETVEADVERIREKDGQSMDGVRHTMINDVKLALLRLYDQRGQSEEACTLAAALRKDAEQRKNQVIIDELDRWYGYCDALGNVLDAAVTTTDGKRWTSKDQVGKVVVIHFFADWYPRSIQSVIDLRRVQEDIGGDNLSVLSVDLSGSGLHGKAADAINWPICSAAPGPQTLRKTFSVQSLPRYVVIDREGKIVSIGSSLVMLDQVEEMAKKEASPAKKGK